MASESKSASFVSHAATYALGNIARRIVGFAMLPIYTRYLTPADYGVIGLLTFALALFEPVFGARMGRAIPKFYFDTQDERARRAVIWSTLTTTAVVSAVSMTAFILLRGVGSQILFGDRRYALALGLFAVNLLSRPMEDVGMLYIRLQERSRLFLNISLGKLALQVALNLILVVWWNGGVVGVVLSGIISSIVLGIGLLAYIRSYEPPAMDRQITREMVKFCWPLWLSGLAGLYMGSSGGMYLRLFDSLSDVGRLELALKFAAVISTLIFAPFFQHWEPTSYRYYQNADGKRRFQVAFIGISTLLFVGGLGISIFSQPVIRVMSAKSFYAAAAAVPILTFAFVLESLRSFFNFSFLATGRTTMHSLCQYITVGVITLCYVVLVPRFGLLGAAWGQCIAYAAAFVYVRVISRRYYDPGFSLAPIAIFTLIGAAAYACSNVLLQARGLGADLLIKSVVLLVAAGLMGLIGIRTIRTIDASSLDNLPWPFDRLRGARLERQSGA